MNDYQFENKILRLELEMEKSSFERRLRMANMCNLFSLPVGFTLGMMWMFYLAH